MKIEMRESQHLWIIFGKVPFKEVIIDREHGDVRVRIGNDIVKLKYEGNELAGILVNDEYVYRRE